MIEDKKGIEALMLITAGITVTESETCYGAPSLAFASAAINAVAVVAIVENLLQLPGQPALRSPRFVVKFEELSINGNQLAGVCAVYAPCRPSADTLRLHMPTTVGTQEIEYQPLIVDPDDIEPGDAAAVLELLHLAAQRAFTFAAVKAMMTEQLTRQIAVARRVLMTQEIELARLESSEPHAELGRK